MAPASPSPSPSGSSSSLAGCLDYQDIVLSVPGSPMLGMGGGAAPAPAPRPPTAVREYLRRRTSMGLSREGLEPEIQFEGAFFYLGFYSKDGA